MPRGNTQDARNNGEAIANPPVTPISISPMGGRFPPIVDGALEGPMDELGKAIRVKGRKGARKPTAEEQKYLDLIRGLTDSSVSMVIEVATCTCEKRSSCDVFQQAQAIAKVIKNIQAIAPEAMRRGTNR